MNPKWGFRESEEVRDAVRILKEAPNRFPVGVQGDIRKYTQEMIEAITMSRDHMKGFVKLIQDGSGNIEDWVFSKLADVLAGHLESGNHHVYRGVLDILGQRYLRAFDQCIEILINTGIYTREWIETNVREVVYRNIAKMG